MAPSKIQRSINKHVDNLPYQIKILQEILLAHGWEKKH